MKNKDKFEILFTISTGLLVLFALTNNKYLLHVIICFNIITLFIKPISMLCSKAWIKISELLSILSSSVLLSFIYFLFLTPIAILYRLFNGNKLKAKGGVTNATMFRDRNYTYKSTDLDYTW